MTQQTYLNHASISPLLPEVKAAVTQLLDNWHTGSIRYFPLMMDLSRKLRQQYGALIGATPDQVSIQPNTATSMGILANGIDWQPGDEVIVLENDFPSITLPFVQLQNRYAIKVNAIPYQTDPDNLATRIAEKVTPKTRIIAMSFVGYMSGVRHPVEAVATLCQDRNIICAIDATQGIGVLPLNVSETPIDFLAVSPYKWLMCPLGVAFFYISDTLSNQLTPNIVGWLSNNDPATMNASEIDPAQSARKFESGGKPILGLTGATAAMTVLESVGWPTIQSKTRKVAADLYDLLSEWGADLYTPPNTPPTPIISIHGSQGLFDQLTQANIVVTSRQGLIRFSPHYYQNSSEIQRALQPIFK